VGASPVGFDDTTFGAACGACSLEHGVPGIGESAIFRRLPTLVFERFHGADAVRVAGCGIGLCGFHDVFMGVNCPWNPPLPMGSPGNSHGRFDEMPTSGPVGRNEDRDLRRPTAAKTAKTGACLAIRTRGPDSVAGA